MFLKLLAAHKLLPVFIACATIGASEVGIVTQELNAGPTWTDRIVLDPKVLTGKPIIKGTRLSVEFIIGLLAQGWTESDLLENYPGLTVEDIRACLSYARDTPCAERVYPLGN